MSFYYDMYPISDNISQVPQTGLKARAVSIGTQGIEYIAERIASRQTFSKGEILGILHALTEEVEYVLASGFNADLGDLGIFSISATSRTVQNKDEIRSETVELKRIVHRSSPKMTKRLKTVPFQRIEHKPDGSKARVKVE